MTAGTGAEYNRGKRTVQEVYDTSPHRTPGENSIAKDAMSRKTQNSKPLRHEAGQQLHEQGKAAA